MEYFRIFKKAVGWNWVRIPSIITAVGGGVLLALHRFGIVAMDNIFSYVVAGLSVAVVTILIIVALLHHAVLQARQIAHLERAWDKTGRYDFSMREAIQLIINYFEKNEPADKMFDKIGRACAKIREVGWSGQVKISGHEFDPETNMYEDFAKNIDASFWNKNRIDPNFILSPESDLPRTIMDSNKVSETDAQIVYGKMRLNKEALRAMFSDQTH